MLTENQLEMFGDQMASLYQAFEQDVISDIARRVKKTGRFTETAELQAQALQAAGVNTQDIRVTVMKTLRADPEYKKEVANNTKQFKRDVIHNIRAMEKAAELESDEIIASAGDMAFNKDLSAWHQVGQTLTKDSAIVKIIDEMKVATNGTLRNLTNTMGFKGAHDFTSIENAYIRSLDKAVLKMATGTFSFDQAVNDCVRELAQSGLRSVDYASGRTYQLDTAARMAVRTSCHKLAGKISERNCDATGTDLVEVSSHWGARPEHAYWQGKIYSRSGKNKKYPNFSICRYGEVDGLMGVNCRHDFYPFFEGISEPTKWDPEPSPKDFKGKTYTYTEATQKQRQMERNVRATKREIEAQRAIGGDTTILEAKKRRQIDEYHAFSGAMEISSKDNRLRVIRGSSELNKSKAYKSMEKSIDRSQKNFDTDEMLRKGFTHRNKSENGIEIIDEPTYNKLIRNVKKNNGVVIRGTKEVEEHLAKNNSTASCIGDTLLFSKNVTISDVLEETYHFDQNISKMNNNKPAKERLLLNEIDAQKYLLSVADKYHIPEAELIVTRENLAQYEKGLVDYYESIK